MPGYCFGGGAATREGRSREGDYNWTRPHSSRGSAANSSGASAPYSIHRAYPARQACQGFEIPFATSTVGSFLKPVR